MTVELKEGPNENGKLEFYLVGLEVFEDFDLVKDAFLSEFKAQLTDQLDGIYSRTGTFSIGDLAFKLFFHEDVGIFLQSLEGSEQMNDFLREKLRELLPLLEGSIELRR